MLNPEYVDAVENDPESLKLGFTSDGQNTVEIVIRRKDAHRLGMMLIHKYNERRRKQRDHFGAMPIHEYTNERKKDTKGRKK